MRLTDDEKASVIEEVLEYISEGDSLGDACSKTGQVARRTFNTWLADDTSLQHKYTRACDDRAVALVELSMREARAAVGCDSAGVAAQRLIVDTLKWHASKLAPKKYGDKVENTLVGADGGPIEIKAIERRIVDVAK